MKKRFVAVGIALIMLFGVFALSGCSNNPKWNEPPIIDFDRLPRIEVPSDVSTMEIVEDGKSLEFIIIRNFEDLDNIRNYIEDDFTIRKNFILANDINCFASKKNDQKFFRSIECCFVGIFNGNNNRILDLQFISNQFNEPGSLFAYVGHFKRDIEGGTVKNLIISGNVYALKWAAPIVQYNYGTIENCINFANVTNDRRASVIVAGIVGDNLESGIVRNCINYGQVGILDETRGDTAGGIVGGNDGIIDNCINYGTILGGRRTGGIAGSTGSSTIKNCANYGTIIGIDVDKDSGIVGVLASVNDKPTPDKPTGNKNYGSVIVIKK